MPEITVEIVGAELPPKVMAATAEAVEDVAAEAARRAADEIASDELLGGPKRTGALSALTMLCKKAVHDARMCSKSAARFTSWLS